MEAIEAHFQVLELNRSASLSEIKQAYKDLVMVWHPDRFGHNPRLQQKAEVKLQHLNNAYASLCSWCQQQTLPSSPASPRTAAATPPTRPNASRHAQRGYHDWVHQAASGQPTATGTYGPGITFAIAEFILQHYCFVLQMPTDLTHSQYQGGPFVLTACENPPEVMLSVPCDSLQSFDRILLSIPCKSMGHFHQQEAERLLQLLHAQVS